MKLDPKGNAVGSRQGPPTWMLALLPALAWAAQFETVYVLAPPTRRPEHVGAIRWVSFFALAAAATSTWLSYVELQNARRELRPSDRRNRASVWLAGAGMGMGLFFCLVIMATVLVTWFVSPED